MCALHVDTQGYKHTLRECSTFCFPLATMVTRTPLNVTLVGHCLSWCFSDRASWIYYILITNLMHWLLFIHKIPFSSTCFEPQVLIFRRIQLCTCIIWYCHSVWEFLVACRYTAWVRINNELWINNDQCIKMVINI